MGTMCGFMARAILLRAPQWPPLWKAFLPCNARIPYNISPFSTFCSSLQHLQLATSIGRHNKMARCPFEAFL